MLIRYQRIHSLSCIACNLECLPNTFCLFCFEDYARKSTVVDVAIPKCETRIETNKKVIFKRKVRRNWPRRFLLPKDTLSVTIKVCNCSDHKVGILASISNGNVTDGSWRCANSTFCNWKSNNCTSVTWEDAFVVANNSDNLILPRYPEIASNAQWIWIRHSFAIMSVWCKKTFGKLK